MGSGDEREGLPSASGIETIKLCPGSFNYKKLFPRVESGDASEGTIRHDLIEQVIVGDLAIDDITDQQQHECTSRALMILKNIEKEIGVGTFDTQWLEKRVWLNHGEDKLYSAKYDLLRCYRTGDSYIHLLVDWKTLYGDHTPAQNNIQLLAQAMAVYRNSSEVSKIYCALAEPFPKPTYSLVEYSPDRLDELESMLQEIVGKAHEPDAPRQPGLKQCKYCDGLGYCPEVKEEIEKASVKDERTDLATTLELAVLADKWATAVKKRARDSLNEGDKIKGWKLRSSGSVKSIKDADACAQAIMATNQLDWTELLSASSISWSKLIKAWGTKRQIGRTEAIEELSNILEGVVHETPKSPSLIKSK